MQFLVHGAKLTEHIKGNDPALDTVTVTVIAAAAAAAAAPVAVPMATVTLATSVHTRLCVKTRSLL